MARVRKKRAIPTLPYNQWIPLASTCFSEVMIVGNENSSAVRLALRFRQSGRVYTYMGLAQEEAIALLISVSAGKHYNFNIKGQYRWM